MSLRSISARDALPDLARFDAIIDVRAPAEFAEDHLPGAVNWPVLDDDERRIVGTLYKQESPLAARKLGAALVARNIAKAIEHGVQGCSRDWQPLVYCWRGGQRSGAMAWFLDQIGFRTTRLDGGYKAYRHQVLADLDAWPQRYRFRVLAGRTGSGKTRLLQALAAEGAQVLDLEALACHRGSILGALPGQPQPSQKQFDSRIWRQLAQLDPAQPVWVESESRKIGRLRLPEALEAHLHQHGSVLRVEMPEAARVQLLLEDYGHLRDDAEGFCRLLQALVELRGRDTVQRWQDQARCGDFAGVFGALMREHYDPLYNRSIDLHYRGFAQAPQLPLADGGPASLRSAAQQLLHADSATAGPP